MDKYSVEAKARRKGKFGFLFIVVGFALAFGADLGVPAPLAYVLAPIMIILGIVALIASRIE